MANNTILTRVALRTKTAAEWEIIKNTDIPLKGEYCYVSDVNKVKMGDGVKTFYELPWLTLTPEEINNIVSNGMLYSTDVPTVNAFGGIPAGWTAKDKPMTEVIDQLLHPWVAPVVKATTTPNGGVFEKGDTKTINAVHVDITRKSAAIKKVEILTNNAGNAVGTLADGVTAGGSFNVTITEAALSSVNTFYTAKVTDSEDKVTSANSGTFTFVYPFYYGAVNVAAPTADIVKALTKKVEVKGNKAYTFTTANNRACFAYPKAYGNINKILDANGFDSTGTFVKSEVSITGLDGTAQAYYVYTMSAPATITNFKYTFQF